MPPKPTEHVNPAYEAIPDPRHIEGRTVAAVATMAIFTAALVKFGVDILRRD
jgi:hypothetical protein